VPESLLLNGGSVPRRIGDTRVSFAAPGLTGELTLDIKEAGGEGSLRTRSGLRDSSRPLSNDEIDQAIEEVGSLESYNLETEAATPVASSTDETTRSGPGPINDDEAVVEYDPNPGEYSYVIYRDEAGVISLHFPENLPRLDTATGAVKTTRGPGDTQRYRIVLRKPPSTAQLPTREGQTRFGIVTVGKKLIKLVVGKAIKKATAPFIEAADYGAVWLWESRARAFQGFHTGRTVETLLAEDPVPMTDTDWKTLDGDGKKSLLLIHGTTSTTSGAFGGLNGFPDAAKSLYEIYGSRVLGFNHHTLTLSVADNVADFYKELPAGGNFQFDIVCHSRGGLVARALKELAIADVAKATTKQCACNANVSIGKIVFVGTPNIGTQLADPKDIPYALEVLSNVASLIPGAGLTLAGIFSGAAFVAENGFKVLPGMRNMNPSDDFLKQLNAVTASGLPSPIKDYSAIQSSFSSTHLVNRILLRGARLLFKDNLNDLIVPTLGTSNIDGNTLADKVIMYFGKAPKVESIAHTQYFKQAETWDFILQSLR
jgi:pimeloyl-ACP methyl ester carboxylesterase